MTPEAAREIAECRERSAAAPKGPSATDVSKQGPPAPPPVKPVDARKLPTPYWNTTPGSEHHPLPWGKWD
jgi:hypothetical protein